MSECAHQNLLLLTALKNRIRCRHCHLTLRPDELKQRWCPECYESSGKKRTDFDKVTEAKSGGAAYRCEDCSAFISVQDD